MPRPRVEWDPSWDDDWRTAKADLDEMIEEQQPADPKKAVEYYQYGFSAARRSPLPIWSDVESELYQDYMGEPPESNGTAEDESMGWEQRSDWTRRGWEWTSD